MDHELRTEREIYGVHLCGRVRGIVNTFALGAYTGHHDVTRVETTAGIAAITQYPEARRIFHFSKCMVTPKAGKIFGENASEMMVSSLTDGLQ